MTGLRETLLGPSYFYHRRLIKDSKSWSPTEISEYQERWSRRLSRRYGDEITQRDDYSQYPGRYTRWNVPLLARTVRSGGTCGQPLRFTADRFARRQKERAYLFDIWSQIGYSPYNLAVRFRGDLFDGVTRYDRLQNVWIISQNVRVGRELDKLQQWLRALPPFFLHVYPSSLYTFIDLVGEDLFRRLPIRGVMAGSEVFAANEQLRFKRDFGIDVAHWYGHSEYAVLAYFCQTCRNFHFYPTYGQVELLSCETEGCRRVVASSFNRIGTQFVRYDTRDLAVDPVGSCSADNFPRVSAIVGREQETFIDNSGRRRSLNGFLLTHYAFNDQIQDIQFVQERAGFLLLRIVPKPGAVREQLEQAFERRIHVVQLEFEYVAAIERSPSGKRISLVGKLNTEPAGSQ